MFEPQTLAPGEKITRPGLYAGVSAERYHSGVLCDGPSISSSGLRTIFSKSPAHYKKVTRKETKAFAVGRALHHSLLGEADFDKHFAVRPEKWDSWRTADAKAWRDLQIAKGRTPLEPAVLDMIASIRASLAEHPLVQAGILNGLVEQTLATKDLETGVWLLARPDVIPNNSGDTSDFKSTTDVSLDALERSISDFRYDMQGAVVRRCMREVLKLEMTSFSLVWAEKAEPFCTQVTEITLGEIEEAEVDVQVALRTYARCLQTGVWPGPGGTTSDAIPVGLTPWARKRADTRRAILEQELAAA